MQLELFICLYAHIYVNTHINGYKCVQHGPRMPPSAGESQFFCHLSVFRSEIVQTCRAKRLTYSGQVS